MRRRLYITPPDPDPDKPIVPEIGTIEVRLAVTTAIDFGDYFNYDFRFTSLVGTCSVSGIEIQENVPYQVSLDSYANSYLTLLTEGHKMSIKLEYLGVNNNVLGLHTIDIDDDSQSIRTGTIYLDRTSMTFNQDW